MVDWIENLGDTIKMSSQVTDLLFIWGCLILYGINFENFDSWCFLKLGGVTRASKRRKRMKIKAYDYDLLGTCEFNM